MEPAQLFMAVLCAGQWLAYPCSWIGRQSTEMIGFERKVERRGPLSFKPRWNNSFSNPFLVDKIVDGFYSVLIK
jgi:hypothetical protein